jgi:hypothetical protein
VSKVGRASAPKKQRAKDLAARVAFDWLLSHYPSVDLSDF